MTDRPQDNIGEKDPTFRRDMLARAADIVSGARDEAYGTPEDNFQRIATLWSVVFGIPVTTTQVSLAMIQLKVAREVNRHSDDNFIDIAGYSACGYEIEKKKDDVPAPLAPF